LSVFPYLQTINTHEKIAVQTHAEKEEIDEVVTQRYDWMKSTEHA